MQNTGSKSRTGYQRPKRIFEDSGTVNPEVAYFVPLDNVTNTKKQDIKTMVDQGRYFSIFAPRQSGKTTFFRETCRQLHNDTTYAAIMLSFQDHKNLNKKQFYASIERYLYRQLIGRLNEVGCEKLETVNQLLNNHHLTDHISFKVLFEELNKLIKFKKIVIFIDEFDGIPLDELANFLTTLRELYQNYKDIKQKALYSVGLVGIRNITKLVVGGVSPFNIADQVNLPPFSLKNIGDLYAQYTSETDQPFTEEAVKTVFKETAGQPWLVNRLGTILTMDIKPETTAPINEQDVEQAIEMLLIERNAHFDNLYEKAKIYKETFVKIVFDHVKYNPDFEEQTWLEQYGLVTKKEKKAVVANNIYKKRFIDAFFNEIEIPEDFTINDYILPQDRLDMGKILLDFDQYIAQIGVRAFYQEKKPYEKTGQFLLTAWLYRFVKGGNGDLRDETRSGLGRMDIILFYKGKKYIIETKVNHQDNNARIIQQGLKQISQYLTTESSDEGYLVVFDTRTHAGALCIPQEYWEGSKKIIVFIIGIGRNQ